MKNRLSTIETFTKVGKKSFFSYFRKLNEFIQPLYYNDSVSKIGLFFAFIWTTSNSRQNVKNLQ